MDILRDQEDLYCITQNRQTDIFVQQFQFGYTSDLVSEGQMVFVPSYLDYVRLRSFLRAEEFEFEGFSEYASGSEVARGRSRFAAGKVRLALYTERAHFYHRRNTKGVKVGPSHPNFDFEVSFCQYFNGQHLFKKVYTYSAPWQVQFLSPAQGMGIQSKQADMSALCYFPPKLTDVLCSGQDLYFYQLPEHAQFYNELVALLAFGDGADAAHSTVTVMVSKTDALRLERVVGSRNARRMLKAASKTFMFSQA